jgi:hypothetical protein
MMKNNAERIIENLGLVAFNSMQIQAQEAIATNHEVVLIAPRHANHVAQAV